MFRKILITATAVAAVGLAIACSSAPTKPESNATAQPGLGAGTPGAPCSTDRLGKSFTKDGKTYVCQEPKPYAWRESPTVACEHGTLPNGSCAETGTPLAITVVGTTPATTAAAPAGPATTITDGTWTVGEDIAAGTYKTTGSGSTCYWSITKTGSNGSDIVNNHIGGGNLRVTLKAGQDFETNRCGTWAKV